MMAPHPDAADIAAEVAARYGAIVSPDVVRAVPVGVSGLPVPVWNGYALVMPEGTKNHWKQTNDQYFIRAARKPKPEIIRRQIALRALHAEGLNDTDIAAQLGCTKQVVYSDRAALGLPNNNHAAQLAAVTAKHDTIRAMALAGAWLNDIAAAVGLMPETVQDVARHKFGLQVRRASPRDLRLALFARMLAEGADYEQLRAAATVCEDILRADLRGLGFNRFPRTVGGVVMTVGGARWRQLQAVARRARVAKLLAQGLTPAQIQAEIGMTVRALRSDMYLLRRAGAAAEQQVAA